MRRLDHACTSSSLDATLPNPARAIAEAMSGSASTTLQYTGIGAFVAIVLLGLVYFGRAIITGRHDVHTGHGTATASPGQQLGLALDDIAVLPTFTYLAASPGR